MDCVLCGERKAFVYVDSINLLLCSRSVCLTVLQKMPSSYAKFRIAIHDSHAALSKSTLKKLLPECSLPNVVKMSKSAAMPKLFPLLYTRAVHFLCLPQTPRLYLVCSLTLPEGRKDERVLPVGLQSHIFFSSSSCRKCNVSH